MGKTIGSILAVGAAIAINVIPGIGNAISGAIFAGLGGTAAAASIAIGATYALSLGVTAYGLQAGASLLGLGPTIPKPDTTVMALKTSRPPRVSAYGRSRLYGAYIFFETAGNGTATDVFAVHDGLIDGIEQYYIGDDLVTVNGAGVVQQLPDERYQGDHVSIQTTNGQTPGIVNVTMQTLFPGVWTSSHRGDGIVLLFVFWGPVKSKYYMKTYPNGQPAASLVGRWQRCPDPFHPDPSNPAGWTWTENPVRQMMHYRLVHEGLDYVTKIAPTLAYWQSAAAVCDAPVALKAGGTEPRYRSSVAHKHTDAHKDVNAALLSTFDGWMAPRADGAIMIYPGRYYAPTVTIGPDQIVAYDWDGVGVDDDKAINEIICSYISAAAAYNVTETDAWRDEDDIAERGAVLSQGLDPSVPSWGQVRYLAKRKMSRGLAPHRGTVTTNVSGRIVRGQRYIWLRIVEAGTTWYDGPAEILSLTRNLSSGGVTFSWVVADPNIDIWNPAFDEGNPATVGDRVAQEPLEAPVIDAASAVLSPDGSSARASLNITGPNRTDLTWFIRWRISGAVDWSSISPYDDADPGASVFLVSDLIPINAIVETQTAYTVGDGRQSPWSETEDVNTSTASIAPGPTAAMTVDGDEAFATVEWTNPTSSNLAFVRIYRGTTSVFGAAVQTGGDQPAASGGTQSFIDSPLPADTYHYWTRAYNGFGTGSTLTGPVTAIVT